MKGFLRKLNVDFGVRGVVLLFTLGITTSLAAQFAPPAGQAGSTAVHKDSSIIVAWATSSIIERGWQDIGDTLVGRVTTGDSLSPVGAANGTIISLGDGGTATMEFAKPIVNGTGADFAVFENSFSDKFLELAFVEVSSDGQRFVRFPATSNTQDTATIGGFGEIDATLLNNLAGKYRATYGTPFDLEELKDSVGLDVNKITHVRVVDCVGSLNPLYATYDKNGNMVNEPWPTPFPSSGFDLDAVAVIHELGTTGVSEQEKYKVGIYPNPVSSVLNIRIGEGGFSAGEIFDINGRLLLTVTEAKTDVSDLRNGFYFFHTTINGNSVTSRFIVSR